MDFASLQQQNPAACANGVTISGGLRRWRAGLVETTVYEMALKAGAAQLCFCRSPGALPLNG